MATLYYSNRNTVTPIAQDAVFVDTVGSRSQLRGHNHARQGHRGEVPLAAAAPSNTTDA